MLIFLNNFLEEYIVGLSQRILSEIISTPIQSVSYEDINKNHMTQNPRKPVRSQVTQKIKINNF
jgi:hypothetical protein